MKILLVHFKTHSVAYDITETPDKVEVIEFSDNEKIREAKIIKFFMAES